MLGQDVALFVDAAIGIGGKEMQARAMFNDGAQVLHHSVQHQAAIDARRSGHLFVVGNDGAGGGAGQQVVARLGQQRLRRQPVDNDKALAGENLGDGGPLGGGRGHGHGPQFTRSGARLDRAFLPAKAGNSPILTWETAAPKDRRPTAGPLRPARAQMAELVDALVSGTSAARRGGSSPLLGTRYAFADVR